MKIGKIDASKKVFIIAEIGNNHEGNFELAKKMISKAAAAKVDAVKFQTFIPEHISGGDSGRLKRLYRFKFTYNQFKKLASFAKKKKVLFFSTPFDIESAKFLNTIQPVFKIASGDNNFYPLIKKILSFNKPVIISTGSADINLVKTIYKNLKKFKKNKKFNKKLAFLHCVSSYPVPYDQANLASITYLKNLFTDMEIGYSDHTLGLDAAVFSVFAGARIIEKHFTLNKNFSNFRDHQLSADPKEMSQLVEKVRKAESMLGLSEKKIQKCEKDMNYYGRRSIAAANDIKIGSKLKLSNLIWIRPGSGFKPGEENMVLNKKVRNNLKFAQILKKKDLS